MGVVISPAVAELYVQYSTGLMLVVGVITLIATLLIRAPYGRYASRKWGPMFDARLAWFLQESPAFWVPQLVMYDQYLALGGMGELLRSLHPCAWILLLFFQLHYFQRAVIYPLCRMPASATPVPLTVSMLAFLFCLWNGLQQSLALVYVVKYDDSWMLGQPFFRLGMTLAFLGMFLNIHSDSILLNLRNAGESAGGKATASTRYHLQSRERSAFSSLISVVKRRIDGEQERGRSRSPRPANGARQRKRLGSPGTKAGGSSPKSAASEKEYKIPYGGLFEYTSAANLTAEILEWGGFAIAACSLPAAAFAWYTFSNIGPRGHHHHQWYLKKFGEAYPKHRKAVIPFIW
ncbi:unnamed protein product [Amoebophrya sp. A25]|nr:unnamed protein product [Amoebophrya sp. A25]|eukprot:GSA25T00019404001.1